MSSQRPKVAPLRTEPPMPPDSELPPEVAPPEVEEVIPRPETAGGLDNIPEALIPESEAAADELDHAGLETELPEEDHAPAAPPAVEEQPRPPEKWGVL